MTDDAPPPASPDPSSGTSGWVGVVTVDVASDGRVSEVLDRCREALAVLDAAVADGTVVEAASRPSMLPAWLLAASEPEPAPDGGRALRQRLQGLPPDGRVELARTLGWTVSDLVSWFEPGETERLRWDAAVVDDQHALVRVHAQSFRTPIPALLWLIRAAGASGMTVTDERPVMLAADRDGHPLAPKLAVPGVDEARRHLLEIADELVQQFGLDGEEAVGRVNEYFAGLTYFSKVGATMLMHEDPEDWAPTVYFGRGSYWWVAGRDPQQPLPYPGFDPDVHGR